MKKAGVPVILDVGGMDTPIPNELLDSVDILSPNETELSRLTGMPTETFEQISQAVAKCHKLVGPFFAHCQYINSRFWLTLFAIGLCEKVV